MASRLALASFVAAAACRSARCFDVAFTHIDPHERLLEEVTLVDTVRRSRLQFPDAAADNFVVKYAVYGLLDQTYIKPVVEAAVAGVRCQVLLEHRQLFHSYVTVWKDFQSAGLNVTSKERTQHNLTNDERESLNLIGMDVGGLFHFKLRYFKWRDLVSGEVVERVVTGSLNPEDSGIEFNVETIMTIDDVGTIRRYLDAYHDLLYDRNPRNVWEEASPLNVLVSKVVEPVPTPKDAVTARAKVFELINAENEGIFIPNFAFRNLEQPGSDSDFLTALCAAKRRGAFVAIASNKDMIDGDKTGDFTRLAYRLWTECKIPVYKARIYGSDLPVGLHEKNAIFNAAEPTVVSDTTNWSKSGLGANSLSTPNNAETMLVVRPRLFKDKASQHVGMRFLSNFWYVMRRFAYQQACPYTQVDPRTGASTEIRENCADGEPYKQPDWDFVPQPPTLLEQAIKAAKSWPQVQFSVKAFREATVQCRGTGMEARDLQLRKDGNMWVSEPVPVPAFAHLRCTLRSTGGVDLSEMLHIADPAVAWAEDGTTAKERLSDENLMAGCSTLTFHTDAQILV